jgi:hypothetical protein
VIPVLLLGADRAIVDAFLELNTWVDFGDDAEYAFHLLSCGVRGEAPGRWRESNVTNSAPDSVGTKLRQLTRWKHMLEQQVVIETQQKLLDQWMRGE